MSASSAVLPVGGVIDAWPAVMGSIVLQSLALCYWGLEPMTRPATLQNVRMNSHLHGWRVFL